MANEISLVTASGRTVTPKDDGIIYEVFSPGNGIIYGGAVTIKDSSTLHITAGHGIVCGRKFTIDDSDIPVALSGSGSLLGRLYIHLDLADAADPITLLVETGESLTPEVHDQDVNINNGVYDINLVTFDVDTVTISNLVDVTPKVTKGDGSGGIRYDEITQYVQCKDSNGWFNWRKATRIPDGRTVTPINDVELLQECAGLPATYSTLASLLADTVTMASIIADNNAADYLARSTGFASDVCADNSAMTAIGANNYCANALIANPTWLSSISTSSYETSVLNISNPIMTSNTAPSGRCFGNSLYDATRDYYMAFNNGSPDWYPAVGSQAGKWVGYEFVNSTRVCAFKVWASSYVYQSGFKIQKSEDGSTWADASDEYTLNVGGQRYIYGSINNPTSAKYWRLYLTKGTGDSGGNGFDLFDCRFYGREDV